MMATHLSPNLKIQLKTVLFAKRYTICRLFCIICFKNHFIAANLSSKSIIYRKMLSKSIFERKKME